MTAVSWVLTDVTRDVYVPEFSVGSSDFHGTPKLPWSIRKRTLRGGLRDGVDVVEINNGRLSFAVVPTRGMGIWKGSFDGLPLGWKSPIQGPVHPQYVNSMDRGGIGWIAGFDEWICRCGLDSNGAPGEDVIPDNNGNPMKVQLPLHGKIANLPAGQVKARVIMGDEPELAVTGRVQESMLFSPQLELRTSISTRAGSNRLVIRDEVVNLRSTPAELELLYHCNFGGPFLDAGARLVAPVRECAPRDARAAEGIDTVMQYPAPTPGFIEQAYWFDLHGEPASDATLAMLRSGAGDKACVLRFSRSQLPCFTLWKNPGAESDGYVTGLEPGTNYPNTKRFERERGRVLVLPPGGSHKVELWVEVLDTAAQVAAVEAECRGLARTPAVIHRAPHPKYSPV